MITESRTLIRKSVDAAGTAWQRVALVYEVTGGKAANAGCLYRLEDSAAFTADFPSASLPLSAKVVQLHDQIVDRPGYRFHQVLLQTGNTSSWLRIDLEFQEPAC